MTNTASETVEQAVIRELTGKSHRPLDLLEEVIRDGYTAAEVKAALAQLLHNGDIALTSDRVLRAAA